MGFSFGSYDSICAEVAMVVCPLLGSSGLGLEPVCYSRNVEINKTIIFEPATCFIDIAALIMTAIMVYHIRSKYTAVGRKEIVLFFYLYAISEILVIFLNSAIIPTYSAAYLYLTGVYVGLKTAIFWCLLINGFVGFQFAEDGTPKSLWFLRLSSLVLFAIGLFVSLATFKGVAGSFSRWRACSSTPSRRSCLFYEPSTTDGHWATSLLASSSSLPVLSSCTALARRFVAPSSTTLTVPSSGRSVRCSPL